MGVLDLIFPPRCGGCGGYGSAWCERCAASVQPVPVTSLDSIPLVAAGRLEGPLQQAIHTFKYRPRPGLAGVLADPLRHAIADARLDVSGLAYIPLHPQRRRQRGFNQAERLAAELARPLGLPLVKGLSRVRPTPAQVGLSQPERQVNMVGAFEWTAASAAPSGLALVDDVCTTGATLQAAADAVARAGGSIAAFLVLARAQTLPALAVTSPDQTAWP